MGNTTKTVLITLGIIGFIIIILMINSISIIDAGYAGIVYSLNGGIKGKTLNQGMNFKVPFVQKVNSYTIATEQAYLSKDKKEGSKDDDSFNIPTSDGKTVNVDLEFSYHFDAEKLPETFVKFKGQDGKTIENNFMRGKIKAWCSEITSTFSVLDIYGEKRAELNAKTLKHVQDRFNEYGIVIDSLNFSRIELDEKTAEAIQSRINAQQKLEQQKTENEKAKLEAEKKVTEAEATAKANNIINSSLNADNLEKIRLENQKKAIEKWNGQLPNTMTGDNVPLLNIK